MNVVSRVASYEPLSASKDLNFKLTSGAGPFSYLSTGAVVGFSIWYYDYWRRRAVEEVLYADERRRYH